MIVTRCHDLLPGVTGRVIDVVRRYSSEVVGESELADGAIGHRQGDDGSRVAPGPEAELATGELWADRPTVDVDDGVAFLAARRFRGRASLESAPLSRSTSTSPVS